MTPLDATVSLAWTIAGWTMLHFLWVGSLIGAASAAGRRALRRYGPEVRYAFALASLASLAIAPLAIAAILAANGEAPRPVPMGMVIVDRPFDPTARAGEELIVPDRPPASGGGWPQRGSLGALAERLPWIWIAGAPLTFALLAAGLAGAESLRRGSRAITDAAILALRDRLAAAQGIARPVALAACDRIAAPVLVGIVRPAILLPPAALTGWSVELLEMALLHELTHVRRLDNLVILVQRVIESALFFHPAVWVVSGWAHRDREHCCDRAVVARVGRPLAYAQALVALADSPLVPGAVAAAMASEHHLVARIRQLLEPEDRPMIRLPRTPLALAALLFLVPAFLVGSRLAQSRTTDEPPAPAAADDATRQIAADVLKALDDTKDPGATSDLWTLREIAQAQTRLGDSEGAKATLRRAAEAASRLVQHVAHNGNTTTHGPSRAFELWRVGHFQIEAGDREGALQSLRQAREAVVKKADEQEMTGMRFETLTLIAKELTALARPDEAREIVTIANDLYNAYDGRAEQQVIPEIAAVRAAAGDFDGAWEIVDGVARSVLNEVVKQHITGMALGKIAGAVETADREGAKRVLTEVDRRLEAIPAADLKYHALSELAHAWARIGEYEAAMRDARWIGEGPTRVEYDMRDGKPHAMLRIALEQLKAGELVGTRRTLREGLETIRKTPTMRFKKTRFLDIARGMIRAGDLPGALECANDMPAGQRYETLSAIAAAQRKVGDEAAARATYRRALDDATFHRDHRPPADPDAPLITQERSGDDVYKGWASREIARIQAQMGDLAAAQATAESIGDERVRADAYAAIAHAWAAAGDARGALEWVQSLKLTKYGQLPLRGIIEGVADRAGAGKAF